MTLGQNILKIRKNSGLTREELSKKIGVSLKNIFSWEADEKVPNLEQINLLANALGVDVDSLIDENTKNMLESEENLCKKRGTLRNNIIKWIFILFLLVLVIDIVLAVLCFTGILKI